MSTPSRQALLVTRLIWAMLLLGQIAFAFVITTVIWSNPSFSPQPLVARNLTIASALMMLILLPLALFLRSIIYGREAPIPPARFVTGNIIFLALCDAVTFTGLMALLFHGGPGGVILVPALAVALQIVNYPNSTRLAI